MNVPGFSVRNGVLLTIVLVTLIVLGSISVFRLPQEQYAEVPFYWINIIVPWPGASPEDVERAITVKIEQEMQGLDDLKQIQSVTSEGLSVVRVQFDDGINNERFMRLFQDVRMLFGRIVLPEGTREASIDDFSSNDFLPVVEIVLSGDIDYDQLHDSAVLLQDRLSALSGLSSITATGLRNKRILVNADRGRLEANGIALRELLNSIQQSNISIPGGLLETANREYLVRIAGDFTGIEDFGRLIVRRTNTDGAVVRLSDLAQLEIAYDRQGEYARFNGIEAVTLSLAKVPRGDAVGLLTNMKELVASLRDQMPPGLEIAYLNDSTVQIRDSISVLVNNALQGLFLLSLILFIFLGVRNALITALGIPVTFAVTFLILELMGETLNSNTLFGLVLVLGMIVDHAIVITENSYRLRKQGLSRIDAAVQGTSRVAIPIISSALTTIAAFLPLTLLPGTIGKFLRVIPLTVIVALAVSTVESIVFIPSHLAEWPGGKKVGTKKDFFDRFLAPLEKMYSCIYRKRIAGLLLFAIVLVLIFSTIPFLRQDLFSAEDFSLFYIDIEMPAGTGRKRTLEVIAEYEKRILPMLGNGEIVNVLATTGGESGAGTRILVDLTEVKEGRTRPISMIMEDIRAMCEQIPGPERVFFRKAQTGPPVSAPVGYRLRGDDSGMLVAAITRMEEKLSTYPGLFNIETTLEKGTGRLAIRVNEERAAALGLSIAGVGSFIRGMLDGFPAGSVFFANEEIDIFVRYDEINNGSPVAHLLQLKIPAGDGRFIPFSSVASLEEVEGAASIKRIDGKRELGIQAGITDKRKVRPINAEIKTWFDDEIAMSYPGITLVTGGEFTELGDLLIQILRIFLIGLFLIYAVLGAQFKSYTQPFLILLSIPMAFGGVVLFLLLSGTPFSTTVLYAAVALAGIAVNDSIVLIDFINEERKNGMAVGEAVKRAASARTRPVLLTSITTIAGLLPTALGFGGYSVIWSPMAGTIIFGLVFSTVTTLTVVPMFYGFLYDRKKNAVSEQS